MDLHLTGVEPELPPQPVRLRGRQRMRKGVWSEVTGHLGSSGRGLMVCLSAGFRKWATSKIDRRVQRFYDRDCD